jgi:anti-sigma factor ChrR (cupin superfamily)
VTRRRSSNALWLQARSANSRQERSDLERLALLWQRMAVRVARRDPHRLTLGDLLYKGKGRTQTPETDWIGLVSAVARQEMPAFQTLYLWSHRLLFALLMRLTDDWFATEQLALEVLDDVWRGAAAYDPLDDTVVGWIMNLARSRAGKSFSSALGHHHSPAADLILEVMIDRPAETHPYSTSFWSRTAHRVAKGGAYFPLPGRLPEEEAAWEQPSADISCKLLARDDHRGRVSMLVRLSKGGNYPPHLHAGVEQLHLLQGELWVNDRQLRPGDYNREAPGSIDNRVWSETGCTCILITSSRDIILS